MHFQVTHGVWKKNELPRLVGAKEAQNVFNTPGKWMLLALQNLMAKIGKVLYGRWTAKGSYSHHPLKRQENENDLKQNLHDYVLQPWKSSGVYPDLPVPYVFFKQCPR